MKRERQNCLQWQTTADMFRKIRLVPSWKQHSLYGLTHLAQSLEAAGGDHCLGRFDQYMYAFWQKEKDDHSEQYFQDVIHELKLKVSRNVECTLLQRNP